LQYFTQLEKGPVRPIAVENIYAVNEAMNILTPLKPYVLDSAKAHNIPPDLVAAIILYNRMLKAKLPTYSLPEGLGTALWNFRLGDIAHYGIDAFRFGHTGNKALDYILHILPEDIKLQDDAADFLGGVLFGTCQTLGEMQVRGNEVPDTPKERNVRIDHLLANSRIYLLPLVNAVITSMCNNISGR